MTPPEREFNPRQQMNMVNLLMTERFNELFAEKLTTGSLSPKEYDAMQRYTGEMMYISAAIYQFLMKHGDFKEMSYLIGYIPQEYDQEKYLQESPVGAFRQKGVKPNTNRSKTKAVWPTGIDGLLLTSFVDTDGYCKFCLTDRALVNRG